MKYIFDRLGPSDISLGLHDAFELYGRPEAWTWDPRDPVSLMFGYPVGPQKDVSPPLAYFLFDINCIDRTSSSSEKLWKI